MKTITVENKDYALEYTFEAAECKNLIQKMFNVVSGAYLVKHGGQLKEDEDTGNGALDAIISGTAEMVSEIPHICNTAFYAGLLEHNPMPEGEAKTLMKSYMKQNKISYSALFEEIKKCMEDDGFFELSGLTDMMKKMNESMKKSETPVVKS